MAQGESRFDIPHLEYFTYGNIYTGSYGTFQYKIVPKDGILDTCIWYGRLCCDKSEKAAAQQFSNDEDGRKQMIVWLEQQHDLYQSGS